MNILDTLIYLKDLLLQSLDELKDAESDNQFCSGERTAYVECLEALQLCESVKLDFNIEERYPLV